MKWILPIFFSAAMTANAQDTKPEPKKSANTPKMTVTEAKKICQDQKRTDLVKCIAEHTQGTAEK